MVDPNLNAQLTVSGICFCKSIVDVSSQRMERNITFAVLFGSGDFSSAKSSGCENFYSLGTSLHRSADRLLHSSSEGHSSFQSLCDTFSSQLCIQFCSSYFFDIDDDRLACHLFEFGFQIFNSCSGSSDHHTRSCCHNDHFQFVFCCSFQDDLRYAGNI